MDTTAFRLDYGPDLEAEIARCRAQIEEKKSSRAAADAFFKQG